MSFISPISSKIKLMKVDQNTNCVCFKQHAAVMYYAGLYKLSKACKIGELVCARERFNALACSSRSEVCGEMWYHKNADVNKSEVNND